MKINPNNFHFLLFFSSQFHLITLKEGWLDDSDDGLHDYFIKQLKIHSYKIDTGQGGYDEDDLIDIVNYIAMLYNLGD